MNFTSCLFATPTHRQLAIFKIFDEEIDGFNYLLRRIDILLFFYNFGIEVGGIDIRVQERTSEHRETVFLGVLHSKIYVCHFGIHLALVAYALRVRKHTAQSDFIEVCGGNGSHRTLLTEFFQGERVAQFERRCNIIEQSTIRRHLLLFYNAVGFINLKIGYIVFGARG